MAPVVAIARTTSPPRAPPRCSPARWAWPRAAGDPRRSSWHSHRPRSASSTPPPPPPPRTTQACRAPAQTPPRPRPRSRE